jgi:hypothetical protein
LSFCETRQNEEERKKERKKERKSYPIRIMRNKSRFLRAAQKEISKREAKEMKSETYKYVYISFLFVRFGPCCFTYLEGTCRAMDSRA